MSGNTPSTVRAGRHVPALAAAATALAGAVNVGSAMTAELPVRLRDLLAVTPAADIRLAHALALPAGLALLGAAWPLARRRRRALLLAVALLVALGVLDVLKGLDLEEALISWGVAAVLWRSRTAFWVRHAPDSLAGGLRRAVALAAASIAAATGLVAIAAGHAVGGLPAARVPGAALGLLTLTGGPRFHESFRWLPAGLGLLGALTVAVAAVRILAPLRADRRLADAVGRRRAAALVRRHGTGTLSAFTLRADLQRHWSGDGRAMAAYRIEAGTLLLAGDPIGPPDAIGPLLDEIVAFAHRRGLGVGAIGAGDEVRATARRHGLRGMYLGDEALVATGEMDLAGGAMKSLRKAVGRLRRHGYVASAARVDELDEATLEAMEAVSERFREGAPERGFSMAHDVLVDELLPDALVVLARDAEGTVRGFLHFVPVFGRPVVSLGFMRRDRDTPNGLNDFLVVEAARLLGERGIAEFSLNFSTGGRWLREPANVVERLAAAVLRLADRWLQVERLLRFNAKFRPRWQPRHLLFETPAQLPRVALAAMWAEGQLPKPRRPVRSDRRPVPYVPVAGDR